MTHSIIRQLNPSDEQRPAVLARGKDVVVTAGAGTGKTRTLVVRYLALLEEGLPLRSVVAITFTKKAAREMRNRVRDAMRLYIETPNLPMEERERWQDLYARLDAARIDTIHGLCSEILRGHPAEAQIDPRFNVLDEAAAYILRSQVLDEALAWAADDPQAAHLFALLGERNLRQDLEELFRRRLDTQEALARQPDDIGAHWHAQLEEQQRHGLADLLAEPQWAKSVSVLQENCATSRTDLCEAQRCNALAAIGGSAGGLADRVASLSALGYIRLTGGSAKAWPEGAPQLASVKEALGALRGLWKAAKIESWSFSDLDDVLAQHLPALCRLFIFADERYAALRRERNALDFDDMEAGALQLLHDNAQVRARWQRETQAILVDEFQDTNRRQYELVTLLDGGQHKLFVVGDAKQSIYRFRGADVTVFRTERERVKRSGGVVVSLGMSYRAHRELVENLNDLLRPVLGTAADPLKPWKEPFAALTHHREEPNLGLRTPFVELHLATGSKKSGALERAAQATVARLVELAAKGNAQVESEGGPALNYGDVAILCRASNSFPPYEDALEGAGVPFLTVAGGGFYNRPEIRDLLNALQALSDPSDDLALAGLLRSPAFAFSDVDLYRLCQARQRRRGSPPLWSVLLDRPSPLGEKGRRAAECIARLHELAGRTAVADLLKSFLDVTDYRAAWIQAGQTRAARNVSKLLADAHASGIVSVNAFLEYVQGLRDARAREGEARTTATGAVQIMSVHQAKGLEFPVVVIGDVSSAGREQRSVLVDPELGILLPECDENGEPSAIYALGKSREAEKEAAEGDRLLYVAATRAREKLLLSGCLNPTGWLECLGREGGVPLNDVVNGYSDVEACSSFELSVGQSRVACTVYGPEWAWEQPARQEPIMEEEPARALPQLLGDVVSQEEVMDERSQEHESDPPQRVWRVVPSVRHPSVPAWVLGKLVHEALALWRFPNDDFERWVTARARSYGLTDAQQLKDAVRETCSLLLRFRGHSLFREMDQAEKRLHEVPYSITVSGTVGTGILDALYTRRARWTLVEFKTDRIENPSEWSQRLGARYRAQVERYLKAAEGLLGQRPAFVLCLLNYQGKIHVQTDFLS